jgi:hypothetical protein
MVKKYFLTYCLNYLKGTQNLMCILFLFLTLFLSGNVYAQSIKSPIVTESPICAGSDFLINFTVRNGNTVLEYFTTNTNYTAVVGKLVNGNLEEEFSFSFQSNTQPEQKNNKELNINQTINIPAETIGASNYVLGVRSNTPDVNITTISDQFVIKTKPVIEATNNGPVCFGETLQLNSSINVSGASFSWTDPKGMVFSNSQNPTLPDYSISMEGQYQVIATLNGCQSLPSLTTVTSPSQYTWTGAQDTEWNVANNWSCNIIPNASIDVLIPDGLANYPTLNLGVIGMAKDIQIDSGASLTIIDNTLKIAGSINNTGVFDVKKGEIDFRGTSLQTIPKDVFFNDTIRNITINNTSGVTNNSSLMLTGILKATTGDFNTTGIVGSAFTLVSDATQTAFIDGSGKGDVIGSVKMQRYLDEAFGYKYFSSPFSDSKVGDFSPYMDLVDPDPDSSFPNFYTYDENRQYDADSASTGWEAYTNPSDPLDILKGYALNFGKTKAIKIVEITGTVNNENQQITLENNNRTYTKGFNLVGNPYPSPIDWNAAGWTKDKIDDALYFFTAGSTDQYTGTYSTYIGGTSSDGKSSSIIPSMQGFFVHVSDDLSDPPSKVTATLGLTNQVRTNNFSQEFLKVKEPEKAALIRITAAFENEVNSDPAVLYFPHFAELSFEKDKDALKLMNTDIRVPNLYSLTPENKKLSINALPKPGSDDVKKIPLGLKTEKDGWMLIGLKDLENLPLNFNVYLIDSEKRIGQNLSRKPQYRFYAKSGQHESRFHLMFSETELSDPAMAFDEPFSIRTVGGKVMVSLNLKSGQSGVLIASNVTGQILDRKTVSEKQIIEIEGIKSSGLYFFSINLKDGMFSKKVLIQK